MKAKKLPSGSWRVQVCHEGKRRSFTDADKKTALFLAAGWLANETEKARHENRSGREAIDEYINGRTNLLSPTTIQGYEKARDHFLADYLDLKVGKLTKQKVQSIVNELAGRYSPKTVRNAYGLLRSACELEFKVTLPHKEKLEYRTPGIEGIRSILEAVHGSPVEVPVLLSLWCGLRLSEVRGLRWSRVFSDHIVIDTAIVDVNRKPVLKTPKKDRRAGGLFLYVPKKSHKVRDSFLCTKNGTKKPIFSKKSSFIFLPLIYLYLTHKKN